MSNLALANVEALADSESSEEFYNYTGCYAVLCYELCISWKTGNTYSYASKNKPN